MLSAAAKADLACQKSGMVQAPEDETAEGKLSDEELVVELERQLWVCKNRIAGRRGA